MKPTTTLFDMVAADRRASEVAAGYEGDLQSFVYNLAITSALTAQAPDDYAYRNYYDLILQLGEARSAPLVLPDWCPPGELGQCFYNCWLLALEHSEQVSYVEGMALHSGLPVQHAWLEALDGTIIDPTWSQDPLLSRSPQAFYMGVRFDTELLLLATGETGYSSVLQSDYTTDHLSLKRGFVMRDGTAIARREIA